MGANKNPPDKIFLRGLRLDCIIGVDAAEQHARQAVLLDADIVPRAGVAPPAVDYAVLAKRLREWAEGGRHGLLEEFAVAAADLILAEFAVGEVWVRCGKPQPLPGVEFAGVEVWRFPPPTPPIGDGGGV